MPTPRDVTQDVDPTPEPEDSGRADAKPAARPKNPIAHTPPDPGDEHLGATEDQVSDTTPPAGNAFKDEPKQG
jgi:hypothetical protein